MAHINVQPEGERAALNFKQILNKYRKINWELGKVP